MSPSRAGRQCAHPGCTVIVYHGSRCTAHAEVYHDQDYRAWYQSGEWKRIRAEQLRSKPWCEECAKRGAMVRATDVDHVLAHRGDRAVFFAGPFQSLCHACHSRKTQAETRGGA